jgi:hypothetical protein
VALVVVTYKYFTLHYNNSGLDADQLELVHAPPLATRILHLAIYIYSMSYPHGALRLNNFLYLQRYINQLSLVRTALVLGIISVPGFEFDPLP